MQPWFPLANSDVFCLSIRAIQSHQMCRSKNNLLFCLNEAVSQCFLWLFLSLALDQGEGQITPKNPKSHSYSQLLQLTFRNHCSCFPFIAACRSQVTAWQKTSRAGADHISQFQAVKSTLCSGRFRSCFITTPKCTFECVARHSHKALAKDFQCKDFLASQQLPFKDSGLAAKRAVVSVDLRCKEMSWTL